jgi:GR25 family glycosyltransferase involved in LPS biosynthesis
MNELNKDVYNKINFIDGIVWINLDRSTERKNKLENILKNISIPNYRISAIDGKTLVKPNYNYEREMSCYEIACTQSHIKSIKFLSELAGDYFMVCEDDICFNNLSYFTEDLEKIIKNSPKFDILIIHKIYLYNLEEEYIDWNDHINKYGLNHQICGTACYIVSIDGINNILNKTDNFDVADMYLYKNLRTFVYKYNFASVRGVDSEIHCDHLEYQNKSEIFQNKIIIDRT